ncbi:hypothetical protein BJ170DRAFT_689819 [Xylariales sp. AK1849]|nr:hypothetical protein BJ170DRAFT_689819 [Xylariales sp. AK1849]
MSVLNPSQPGDPPPYILVEVPQGDSPQRYQHDNKQLDPPSLPPRALSAPAAPVPQVEPSPGNAAASQPHQTEELEKESGFAKRFMGNMLVARLGRAGVQSVASTIKLPMCLSPWGDNNPFMLPNLRKRDLALAGVMHLGADALIGSSLTAFEQVAQHGASWTAEQAADQSLEKYKGAKPHLVKRTAGITSVEIRIKHKLIGEQAELRMFEERDTSHVLSYAKGWFCPYLYCSGRAAQLSRMKDFTIAEVMGPGLKADAALAPTLLSCITDEDAPMCRLDAGEDEGRDGSNYKRIAVFFLGISPYRTASAWSQAKVPNEARLRFHLLTHIPAIVVPIKSTAPVCAWSPWTMEQIISGSDDYSAEKHQEGMVRYLESLIDTNYIRQQSKDQWRQELAASMGQILTGIQNMPATLGPKADAFEADRAGVVMLRF